jgi:hypothetical protein
MYRRPSNRQLAARARKLEAMRRGKEAARLARPASGRPLDLPDLRREVIVIDYDTGLPVTHTLHLHKTRRVDTYRIVADGKSWKCGGWTAALDGLRKAYPRVPSPRSDFGGIDSCKRRHQRAKG